MVGRIRILTCIHVVERSGLILSDAMTYPTPVREQNPQVRVASFHQLNTVEIVETVTSVV